MSRPRVTSLVFSPVLRDGRVLRQCRALSADYEVTVVGYGDAAERGPVGPEGFAFEPLARPRQGTTADRAMKALLLATGRFAPDTAYPRWVGRYDLFRRAAGRLTESRPDLVVANDWNTMASAFRAADALRVPVLVDLHEYASRQWEHRRRWRWIWRPLIDWSLRRYLPRAAGALTVSPSFAEMYAKEYGVTPVVVLNAPARVSLPPPRATNAEQVRLVHHGVASRERQLERTVDAVVRAGPRFTLDFMLVPGEVEYIRRLEVYARREAPGRIRFRTPVRPGEIAGALAEYDLGVLIFPPTTFHYVHTLPNKLFEFVTAGLGACVAPSVDMAAFVRKYECGGVAAGFSASDMAKLLRSLSAADIDGMKAGARIASAHVNAGTESAKTRQAAAHALAGR